MLFPVSIIEGGNQEVHCRRRKIENTEKKEEILHIYTVIIDEVFLLQILMY